MSAAYEPPFARQAAMMAEPARARMLACLLSGHYASAGELARAASVTPATASGHLAKLVDSGLVVVEPRGRHRYFKLADADVAHALEALALIAERGTHERQWQSPARQKLRHARCCYGHLAGELGVRLFEGLMRDERLQPAADGYALAPAGERWLQAVDCVWRAPASGRRLAYPCLDWSERRDHLAGSLAVDLLKHFQARHWLRADTGRALSLTPAGQRDMLSWLAS